MYFFLPNTSIAFRTKGNSFHLSSSDAVFFPTLLRENLLVNSPRKNITAYTELQTQYRFTLYHSLVLCILNASMHNGNAQIQLDFQACIFT